VNRALSGWQVYIDANNNGVFDPRRNHDLYDQQRSYKFDRGWQRGPTSFARSDSTTTPAPNRQAFTRWVYYKVTVAANQAAVGKDFGDYLT